MDDSEDDGDVEVTLTVAVSDATDPAFTGPEEETTVTAVDNDDAGIALESGAPDPSRN